MTAGVCAFARFGQIPHSRQRQLPVDSTSVRVNGYLHHIEQTFSKFKQFRRIATRYDKLDRSFDAFICLRVITLYLN